MIEVYNIREVDTSMKVGKHFKLSEFRSSDGHEIVIIDNKLIDVLDQIRTALGQRVYITSGNRTIKLNDSLKNSSKTSKHLVGKAADITFSSIKDDQIKKIVINIAKSMGIGGIGIADTYIHLDTREDFATWTY